MAGRPIWRGHLRLALVSCPVALYPVTRGSSGLHFHFINPATGNRVRMVTLDGETDAELSRGDLVRGFEYERGHHVVLEEADFETARVDSSSLLAIDKFVTAASIDPIYYDTSYYVAPDGDAGANADVYVVLRDAIAGAGQVALSRLVLSRRERAVALLAHGRGLVLHTLHETRDIVAADDAFSTVPAGKPDRAMIDLARQLIDRQSAPFEPGDIEDRYETRLRAVIDAKIEGHEPDPPGTRDVDDGKVVDLMAALRRSLGQHEPAGRRIAAGAKGKATASKRQVAVSEAPTKAAGKAPAKAGRKVADKPADTSASKSADKAGAPAAAGRRVRRG